jgi:hypothetical protein
MTTLASPSQTITDPQTGSHDNPIEMCDLTNGSKKKGKTKDKLILDSGNCAHHKIDLQQLPLSHQVETLIQLEICASVRM